MPAGKQTDFQRAVQAKPDETVVFSWIEWPDKATRDAGMEKMMKDPRMNMAAELMPFDGKRMNFGGFAPVIELTSEAHRDTRATRVPPQSRQAAARDRSADH